MYLQGSEAVSNDGIELIRTVHAVCCVLELVQAIFRQTEYPDRSVDDEAKKLFGSRMVLSMLTAKTSVFGCAESSPYA
jgi:hypothetical protein